MHPAPLPPIFGPWSKKLRYVQRATEKEYCSECPRCGGEPHPDGEWPDRMRWFIDNPPRGWCRRCNFFVWADSTQPPDAQDIEKWKKRQLEYEQERKRSAERAIRNLQEHKIWQHYYDNLANNATARAYWRNRGIPDAFQNYWQFGWGTDGREPVATIPLFAPGWCAQNIKLRYVERQGPGKYTYLLAGVPAPPFRANPDVLPDGNPVILTEGEIKAAVLAARLDNPKLCIMGLPGINPSGLICDELARAGQITYIADPDIASNRQKLEWIHKLPCKVLLLTPPAKIDDMIVGLQLSNYDVKLLLRQALPIKKGAGKQ